MFKEININGIPDFKIGNAQNYEAATGCTVVICDKGATAGVDVRGGAPGTRETDLLDPVNHVDKVHAVLLTGGSAFGLDSASGVMEYLESKGIGFDVGVAKVPIVSAAVLFDLDLGDPTVRPDKKMGYEACINAEKREFMAGNKGAGTGASVGKILGLKSSMKGGLGSFCMQVGELYVAAVVAVNCLGDVLDPQNGRIIAGALSDDGKTFLDSEKLFINNCMMNTNPFKGNTTIGAVITNGILNKAQAKKVASMAHNGYARAIRPSHTMFDGDTIFAISSNKIEADTSALGTIAAKVVELAILDGIRKTHRAYGLRCASDI